MGIDYRSQINKLNKGATDMNTYRVQQQATVWYETTVKAHSKEEAIQLASDIIMNDDGVEVSDSFEWSDEFWTDEEGAV